MGLPQSMVSALASTALCSRSCRQHRKVAEAGVGGRDGRKGSEEGVGGSGRVERRCEALGLIRGKCRTLQKSTWCECHDTRLCASWLALGRGVGARIHTPGRIPSLSVHTRRGQTPPHPRTLVAIAFRYLAR